MFVCEWMYVVAVVSAAPMAVVAMTMVLMAVAKVVAAAAMVAVKTYPYGHSGKHSPARRYCWSLHWPHAVLDVHVWHPFSRSTHESGGGADVDSHHLRYRP
jgi:hypothetical protein